MVPRVAAVLSLLLMVPATAGEGTIHHVATTGDDAAEGTAAAPFRTIQRAAEAARPGDTVLVRPGVYRERVAPPRGGEAGKPIVFRSVERHGAIIRGSDVWTPSWTDEGGGIWSGAVDEALFTDTSHVDGANPFRVASSATPWGRDGRPEHLRAAAGVKGFATSADPALVYTLGQVFVDGAILKQVPFREEVADEHGTWWFDADAGRLFVRLPRAADGRPARPQDHMVEITTRRRIFAPHVRGLGHVEVEGFVLEHCGNQYPADFWVRERPEWQQAGAIGPRSGHHWRIAHNVIRHANGLGIDLGAEGSARADLERPVPGHERDPGVPRHPPGHHLVEGNEILDNGAAGTANYGGTHLVLRRNVVMRNNALHFTGPKRWESAGIKLHSPHDSVIEGNLIADNLGQWGLWLDGGAGERSRVVGNVVIGHQVGVDFEIGDGASCLMANNVLIDNAVGIRFRESGGVTVVHNTVLGSTVAAIEWPFDGGRKGNWSGRDVGVFNNLLVGAGTAVVSAPPADHPRYALRRFDGNLYGFDAAAAAWVVRKQPLDLAGWREAWAAVNEGTGCDAASAAVGPIAHEFDRDTGRLVVRLPAAVVACGLKTIPGVAAADIATDVAGRKRDPAAALPGAWADLEPGENTFRLPSPCASPRAPPRAAAAGPDPRFHLYLLLGQSNMAGRGAVDAESTTVHPRVLMLDKHREWVPATDPLHFDKPTAGVGPGLAFGRRMAEANPHVRIGLVPCAVGGTSIGVWAPGKEDRSTKTHPYDDMLERARAAMQAGMVKGVLWHQGESDLENPGYGRRLTELIERLRRDLAVPDVPFVASELSPLKPANAEAVARFNAVVRGLQVARYACVSGAELEDKGDKLHYSTASARILGRRYAEAMQGLLADEPGPGSR